MKLAIDGGTPIRDEFLPFGVPSLDDDEIREVTDTILSGWIGTGPKTQEFEMEFAAYIGAKYAVAVNSCTAGLHLSLLVSGVGQGDEVITTPLTFVATANVIEHCGAKPVFVDIDPRTLNIDPVLVERAITERTKAILPVHFGGLACDMDGLRAIAEKHRVALIEDAAHAVGTRFHDEMVGAIGDLTSFSFYPNKNMTTIEGGMVTTDSEEWDELLRIYRLHGLSRDAWKRYQSHRLSLSDAILPGYKYNMTDIQASFGLHQLRKLESFLATREDYAVYYDEALASLSGLRTQPRPANDQDRHALHLYVIILEPGAYQKSRNEIVDALMAENIGAAIHYRAVHTHPYYRDKYGYQPEEFPQAYAVGEHILTLPLSPSMDSKDLRDVAEATKKVLSAYEA